MAGGGPIARSASAVPTAPSRDAALRRRRGAVLRGRGGPPRPVAGADVV